MEKNLPPYGQHLYELLCSGQLPKNDVYLFCGRFAWQKADAFHTNKQRPTTLCLPPYKDPLCYFWPVSQCDVLIFETGNCGEDYLNDLAFTLYEHNANIVRCVNSLGNIIKFNK